MGKRKWQAEQGKWKGETGVWEQPTERPTPQQRNTFSTAIVPERALLVAVCTPSVGMERTEESVSELSELLHTAGGVDAGHLIQRLASPDNRTYIGSGKLEELKEQRDALDVDFFVFDDELSPTQLRNLERALDRRILDRTTLILDIFARRARTSTAKTQVELAQLQYMLPRLTRLWTHLERQRGGIGMRGPGETQIETDRRLITDKITLLKERLRSIDCQKVQQRKNRESLVRVALVGYTNAGKSTLLNVLSKSDVLAEDKLFATLDTTVRKVVIGNLPLLLTDTVGFIRKLPHGLVESFKSTLDEVNEADLLVHVVDISHRNHEAHIAAVEHTLEEIGASDKPTLLVFNKTDAYTFTPKAEDDLTPLTADNLTLDMLKESWMARAFNTAGDPLSPNHLGTLFVSARTGEGMEQLRNTLYEHARQIHAIRYPYNNFLY